MLSVDVIGDQLIAMQLLQCDCSQLGSVDATDVSEVCVTNQYVICGRCKILIPDADNFDIHVCEAAGSKGGEEMVIDSSVKGYQCAYCYKTFAQVTLH